MSAKLLPRVVYQMCVHGALLAGSQARKLAGEDVEPGDYDLLVPLEKWQTIALLIPPDAKPNKFGGWRFKVKDPFKTEPQIVVDLNPFLGKEEKAVKTIQVPAEVEVDVWPDSVYNYLANCKASKGTKVCVVDFINNKVYSQERLP